MGRAKTWTEEETEALIQAFIHISEDAITGTNQTSDQLFQRVSHEAKSRFKGDWFRTFSACRRRWTEVSREVQKFCAAIKFVESQEHSGWNEEDYFKAAEEYYVKRNPDASIDSFKFVNEWKYLKDYEKWKTATSSSTLQSKQHKESSSDETGSDSDGKQSVRPIGNKKQKVLAAFQSKSNDLMEKITEVTKGNENQSREMIKVIQENLAESKKNREFLEQVFTNQTSCW